MAARRGDLFRQALANRPGQVNCHKRANSFQYPSAPRGEGSSASGGLSTGPPWT